MLDLPNPPNDFTVEKSLSTELLKLSFEERLAIQEEIHGVRCGATEETSELLHQSLLEFDETLNARKEASLASPEEDDRNLCKFLQNVCRATTNNNNTTSNSNNNHNNCYLNSRDIRLRFLRSECFNVDKAVERFINYLEYSCDIFGDYVCEREICLSDFSPQELTLFRASNTQYLPFRDRSGRRVLIGVGSINSHMPLVLRMKFLLFQHWKTSKDVETQRRGIVIALWPFDEKDEKSTWETLGKGINKDAAILKKRNDAAIPLRIAAFHMYYADTPFFHTLSACYSFYALTPASRAIYRAHFGNHTELCYQFSSYGISPDLLPISATGKVKFGHINALINYYQGSEAHVQSGNERDLELVECPWTNDIIFRKGSTFRNNPGNVLYRSLIEVYSEEHSQSDIKHKVEITHRIMDAIEKRNGRFLEWSPTRSLWIVVSDRARVRKKIAAGFKQYGRRRRTTHQGSNSSNSEMSYKKRVLVDATCCHKKRDYSSLKEYYSMQQHQRPEESCFGKHFHLTE